MSTKKVLMLVTTSAIAAGIVCCISSCKDSRGDILRIVEGNEPARRAGIGLVAVTHGWIEKGRGEV